MHTMQALWWLQEWVNPIMPKLTQPSLLWLLLVEFVDRMSSAWISFGRMPSDQEVLLILDVCVL